MFQKNKPNYGLDAPKIVYICMLIATILIASAILVLAFFKASYFYTSIFMGVSLLISAISTLYPAIAIIFGSYKLKFRERDWLLDSVKIQGHEQVLDVGCGRGLLLIGAAKRLTIGKVTGIDIWSDVDQANNSEQATIENAKIENVLNKIEIITADARQMPFAANSFDLVISSWAIHNIVGQAERVKALTEMIRVLKPGGSVAMLDIQVSQEYVTFFKAHNFNNVQLLGPRYTFGIPTYLVIATKI